MNKKNNRKGFTTVELVIVIAVIAILATVLIPTFSGLIGQANASAALQVASNARTAIMNQDLMPNDEFTLEKDDVVYISYTKGNDVYWFTLTNGELEAVELEDDEEVVFTAANGNTLATIKVADDDAVSVETIDTDDITDLPDNIAVYVDRAQ